MQMQSTISLARNPTLESVLMVEAAIMEHGGEMGKYQIWKSLPRRMTYQTFQVILDYLLASGKIAVDKKGKVVWMFNPKLAARLSKKMVVMR